MYTREIVIVRFLCPKNLIPIGLMYFIKKKTFVNNMFSYKRTNAREQKSVKAKKHFI